MTGVPRHIAEHQVNVREGCPPVRQKKRGQAADRNQAIQEEVGKLIDAGIMKEVHYHSWMSNLVMVKKHDGSWRMCVDFKDLNKACPKDGYHLIKMAKEDEEKTSFITNQGIFCYSKISFGLRNAGETFQRLVDKAFHKQIGRNLEVNVDDLVIKSRTENEIIRYIEETFKTLREINMKLNPKKCTFGVEEGMFLGYKVNTKGIKVCPDKTNVVLSLPSLKCLKEVQKLNGKLASLNRFLAKSAEKSLPFFKTLKKCTKKSDFVWTEEAEFAFKQMKQHIAKLPMLTASEEKEELIIYLAAAKEAVSAVLMTEKEARQIPIYFVSRVLRGPEINYTSMEKLVLALVHASKRLKKYFQAYPIIVVTDQPIKQVLSKPEVAGRLQKWSIELGEYAIHYRPRVSIKGQILEDFIVERLEEDSPIEIEEELPEPWILFTDGSSCANGSRAGLILRNLKGIEFTYALRFRFEATNNEAEYEALNYLVNGTCIAKEADMIQYLEKVKTLTNGFRMFSIKQVPRSENKKADALSKIASTSFAHLSKQVLVEELKEKSINEMEVLAGVVTEGMGWTPIQVYLRKKSLPVEEESLFLGQVKVALGCLSKLRSKRDTEGLEHAAGQKIRSGLKLCNWFTTDPEKSATKVDPNHVPMTFYKWGIDIAGPFSEGLGKVKFLIVAIDYFTKWIEAKPVASITGNQVKKFVWDNIVCRFGLPGEIISDNGKQFRYNPFKDWCEKLCIRQHFAFVKYLQANGLVERANKSLGEGIKARLDARSKDWMEELSYVLWAHRTMIKSSNEDTPFSLTYGTEAVIPADIGIPTLRTMEVDVMRNDEALEINLDLLEQKREQTANREAKSKRKIEKYYNSKVRSTSFKPGDLVYHSNDTSHVKEGGKLGPKWEGPYEVTEALGKGT
ncbi:reverse transcriptase domain-containing protein [Tanacetum coccineum]